MKEKTKKMEQDNGLEKVNLIDYTPDERLQGEKVPNGLVLTLAELRSIKFVKTMKDFNDGKGPKPRYTLFIGEKVYYCPPIVMNLFRRAADEPHLVKIRLKVDGVGLNTRYELDKVYDREAF